MDTVVLLAGGEARRLPQKLERDLNGEPLIVRAVRSFEPHFSVVVSLAKPLPSELAHRLNCSFVIDDYARRGPLGGMVTACNALSCEKLAFVAADVPLVDAALLKMLRRHWQEGDEAVIACHDGGIEPLVGWYDRSVLLREGRAALERGEGAVHSVVERLRLRSVPVNRERFLNVNTMEELRLAVEVLESR